jgi:hypothetical protein
MNRETHLLMRKLPRFVVLRKRKGGLAGYFVVPERLRPEGWPATYALGVARDAEGIGAIAAKGREYNEKLDAARAGEARGPRGGSVPHLIRLLEADPAGLYKWKGLSSGSRATYRYAFKALSAWSKSVGDPPASALTGQGVAKLYAQYAERPHMRRLIAAALSKLLDVAVMEGLAPRNVLREMPLPPARDAEADRAAIWPDSYLKACLEGALERGAWSLARMLAFQRYHAQRPSDAIRLHSDWIKGGWLEFMQQKVERHGRKVRIPVDRRFKEALARCPDQIGALSLGPGAKPHDLASYRKALIELQRTLGLEPRAAKHLRATGILEMAMVPMTALEIAQRTGHSPSSVTHVIKHYLPQDDEMKKAAAGRMEKYLEERESNTSVERS